ncbi:coil containing protein [Vibrio phage 1.081.O._10N.286.52.C2]|nr:coil containing protein [Vibrio phage 1.081.O._10N.286.52.C2]
MITAKQAREKRKKGSQAVQRALDELDLAIQLAAPTKDRVDYNTKKMALTERDELRNQLISMGYSAYIADDKLEVMW